MTFHRRNGKPWIGLSLSRRRRDWIGMSNRLRDESEFLGGLFSTHDVIGEHTAWIDFYFLSRKHKGVFYNGVLDTAKYRYSEMADSQAWDEAELLLKSPPLFEGAYKDAKGNTVIPPRSEPTEPFGGLSRFDWVRRRAGEIADARTLSVREAVEIDPSYRFGLGLHACLDIPAITIESVEDFIRDFWARGEMPWSGSRDLSWPASDIAFGMSSNAIASPAEWAESLKPRQTAASESSALDSSIAVPLSSAPPKRPSL